MILLVRVDDRLLHGQVLGAWVPFMDADFLIIASDESASDSFRTAVMSACGDQHLRVLIKRIEDVMDEVEEEDLREARGILIVSDLKDAMRLYDKGLRFTSLNIGNIHHSNDGRRLSRSVIINREDEEIIERFESFGVEIDIRDIPTRPPVPYEKRGLRGE